MKGLRVLTLALAVMALTAALSVKTHWIWSNEVITQLFWNEQEALVFIATTELGWSGNYLQAGWQIVRNLFGASIQMKARRDSVYAVRCNAAGATIERLDATSPSPPYFMVGGSIYSRYGGELTRWTGSTFQPVNVEDRTRIAAAVPASGAFDSRDGWSHRINILADPAPYREFPVVLGGTRNKLIARKGTSPERWKALDFQREDTPPQRLFYLDERPRTVDERVYSILFQRGR